MSEIHFGTLLSEAKVVVTGGASGIGYAIAKAFADVGSQVVIGGRRKEVVDTAVDSMNRLGNVFGHTLDVSNRNEVADFFKYVQEKVGSVDILIQAAGVNIKNRKMDVMTPEEWDQVLAINATGAYNCIHSVLPQMRTRKSGLIVNISSVAGKRAISLGGVAYSASKFAMTSLGTCLSNELSADGIRITNVYPGEVNTPILDKRPTPVSEEHKQRILQPEDIAKMVVAIAALPPRAHVPEIVIKPLSQEYF